MLPTARSSKISECKRHTLSMCWPTCPCARCDVSVHTSTRQRASGHIDRQDGDYSPVCTGTLGFWEADVIDMSLFKGFSAGYLVQSEIKKQEVS